MVRNALQYLHGFDLMRETIDGQVVQHGNGECYVHSNDEIEIALERWLARCEEFDADPPAYLDRVKRQIRSKPE